MGFTGKPPERASRSDAAAQAAWAALSPELRECGEIAGQRLSLVLSDALRQAEELLFSASAQALTQGECEAILDAAEFARARKDSLVGDFRKHFEQRYIRACLYKPSAISGFRIDFDFGQLQIVKHDLLDDSLDPGKIEEAIKSASWATLQNLTRCFAPLLGNETIKSSDIPLSPRMIEAAVSDAIRDQLWRHEAKNQLIRGLRRFLPERVSQLYRDLTEHMYPMTGLTEADVVEVEVEAEVEVAEIEPPPAVALGCLETRTDAMPREASGSPPEDAVIELALAAAHDMELRSQAEPPAQPVAPLPASLPAPALPEPVARTVVPRQPSLPVPAIPPIEAEHSEPVQSTARMDELEIGVWLEFQAADGSVNSLKLAWISPRKNLYLLTNRQGERALSMRADDLADALGAGRARLAKTPTNALPARIQPGNEPLRRAKKTA